MGIFKRLFGGRQAEESENSEDEFEDEFEEEYMSYAEALAIAKRDAKRGLNVERDIISYVGYDETLGDFCTVEIRFFSTDRGEMSMNPLPLDNREEDEQLSDEKIGEFAKAGNTIAAIRLYRLLHSVDLYQAKQAVERLRRDA